MKNTKLFKLIVFTIVLGFASFGVAAAPEAAQQAAPHYCAAHCAKHTDPEAKMCMTHCTTGVAEGHDCAAHCKSQSDIDKDQACAMHCANSKK